MGPAIIEWMQGIGIPLARELYIAGWFLGLLFILWLIYEWFVK